MFAVFLLDNTASVLQPVDQGVIRDPRSNYFNGSFVKAKASLDAVTSDAARQNTSSNFCNRFTVLDTN